MAAGANKTRGKLEGFGGSEALETGFNERMLADALVELAVLIVGPIDWFEGAELLRIRGQVGSVFLVSFCFVKAMGELTRGTGALCRDPLRSCEGVHELANASASRVRLCRATREDKVADVIKARVASTRIDQLAMPRSLLAN